VTLAIGLVGALVGPFGVASADLPVGSDQDTTGPQIAAFSFAPNSVDVRSTDAQMTGTAHLTDDLSGVDDVSISYQSPSEFQSMSFRFTSSDRASGTALDGMYESTLTVGTYREAGTWTVTGATTKDAVGNTASYTAAQAAALGASPFTVQSNPDTIPPQVTGVRWSPATLDVSSADGSPSFEWDITDQGGSGAWAAQISLSSPSGRQSMIGQGFDNGTVAQDAVTVSGAGQTSTPSPPYNSFENGLSQFSEPGVWTVNYVQVYDRAFNRRLYQGAELAAILPASPFLVVSDPADLGGPEISAFRFSPSSIDVSTAPASVNVEFDVHDDLAGVQGAWVTFQSPTISASPPFLQRFGTFHQYLTEARVLDGTVSGRVEFPTYDRGGDWIIAQLCVIDRVKHQVCYTGDDIATRGPTKLTVIANEPPRVSVTGVVDGTSYTQHPTAGCSVVDREDGTITSVLPVRTGPVDGVYTLTCSYTDSGGKTASSTATYRLDSARGMADLELTKQGPPAANAGEELTYHIRVKNNGPDVATNVMVDDTLPNNLELVSTDPVPPACAGNVTIVCNLGTLAVGETGVATIVARAKQAGPVHNDATAASDQSDPNPADNTGGWSTDVGPPPSVHVHKGVAVLTGPRLRYTIDVENEGPTTAYGVVAKDILDPGWTLLHVDTTQGVCDAQVVCAIGTLTVGQKATVTIEIGIVTFEPVHNEVTATWYGGGIEVAGVTSPGLPFLVVSKAHQGDFFAGGIGTYTVTVSNIGSGPTTEPIVVTDTLPPGMTFAGSSGGDFSCGPVAGTSATCTRTTPLDAQASASFTLTVNVAADAPRQPMNTVEIRGGGGFDQPDPSADPGTIVDPPVLGVHKTVKERVVRIGHNFTYLIDVTNTGARTATNVQVIDTLPGSVNLVSITPGAPACTGTQTIACNLGDLPVGVTVTVEIVVKPREITVLTNKAFAWADGLRPTSSGEVGTDVLPEGHLSVEKVADKPVVLQDSLLRYTITAKNLGPGDASNVKINDPLPAGVELVSIQPDPTYGMTCNVTTPPAPVVLGGPVVCTIPLLPELTTSKVVITVHVLRIGPLANSATVGSDDTGPGSGGTATATVLVAAPSLSISTSTNGTDGGSLWVGDPITWKYHVTNTGNVDLSSVRVTDNKLAPSAINCGSGSNVISSLAVGASVDCNATGTAVLGAYSNVGTGTGSPPVGGNVSATDTSSYTGYGTGLIAPTATTCQQFAGHTSGSLTDELYLVSKGKIGSVAPGVFFYYGKIAVNASTQSFVVRQSNPSAWKPLGVQQAILWDANCTKTAAKLTTDATGRTTIDTSTLKTGTYYISIKYDPGVLVGAALPTPYPTVPYTFGTYLNSNPYASSNAVISFKPKP
jgi:uncharacterized repeat protein (TIGR01451 family)